VGESSDNLPGVPGVGPKTAAKWLAAHGDLAGVIAAAQAGTITGKAAGALCEHAEQVRLNRELNALVTDLELPLAPAATAVQAWDRQALREVMDALEFRTLRDRLLQMMPDDAPPPADAAALVVADLAPGGLGPWLAGRGLVGVDVRGNARPGAGDAWEVALADRSGSAVVLDLVSLGPQDTCALAAWLASASPKAVHAAKTAYHALAGRGMELAGVQFDTELAAYLCQPDRRAYDLPDLSATWLRRELEAAHDGDQGTLDLGGAGCDHQAAVRAQTVADLVEVLDAALADREAGRLLHEVELPLQQVLARMETAGVAVDDQCLGTLEAGFDAQVRQAAEQAYAVIGREVNLGSPKQLQTILFDELAMPKTKKIKTGYTTDAAALADLFARTEHPFLAHLLAHRDAAKMRQTVEGLRRSVLPDGRIHTTFQQTIASTGRISSADPNLQNIPVRTDEGRGIRAAFVVGEGYTTLLTADYSQIEMRIMAHLSGDAGLIDAFRSGEDLHSYVGSRVFGVPTDEITTTQRSKIKAMSYGLAYGLSSYGLSQQLGIDVHEASTLREDYFERFGAVRTYLSGVVAEARKTGYTQTLAGRRRYLPDLTSDQRIRREAAERMALNAPIQGTAADLVKMSMLGVDAELARRGLRSRMLLQVHDELVLEVAPGEGDEVEQLVRQQMACAGDQLPDGPLDVPLDVSVGTGPSWRDAAH
ncbi:MAG: DNA polymerase I, partial [Micrococcales bacterium]|nr:DNA polymerase I [Micrococcales bacterium]